MKKIKAKTKPVAMDKNLNYHESKTEELKQRTQEIIKETQELERLLAKRYPSFDNNKERLSDRE